MTKYLWLLSIFFLGSLSAQAHRRVCTYSCRVTQYYNYQYQSSTARVWTAYEDEVYLVCGGRHESSPGYYTIETVEGLSCH